MCNRAGSESIFLRGRPDDLALTRTEEARRDATKPQSSVKIGEKFCPTTNGRDKKGEGEKGRRIEGGKRKGRYGGSRGFAYPVGATCRNHDAAATRTPLHGAFVTGK